MFEVNNGFFISGGTSSATEPHVYTDVPVLGGDLRGQRYDSVEFTPSNLHREHLQASNRMETDASSSCLDFGGFNELHSSPIF